jgi:hypothetical protein
MIRVSHARQRSNIRVADLRAELAVTIGRAIDGDPDLTHEEILAALLGVADGHVEHLRRGPTASNREDPR